MKNFQKTQTQIVRMSAMMLMVFMSSIAWAQDKGIDIDVNLDEMNANCFKDVQSNLYIFFFGFTRKEQHTYKIEYHPTAAQNSATHQSASLVMDDIRYTR